MKEIVHVSTFSFSLKKTRRSGPLRGPTSSACGGLRPLADGFFCLLGKKGLYYAVLAQFWHFLCLVVTLVTYGSNVSNFERIAKNKKIQKKSPKKIQKI